MLTDPDANLGDDARAALAALNGDSRTHLSQQLGTIVNKKLEELIRPWFSGGMQDWADVDVYAAEMRDGALVLHFIADHYNYNFAQSGSDWADHYVFVGEACLVGGKRKQETFTLERHVHLTEHEHEDYDPRKIIVTVRAEKRAKLRSGPTYRCPKCRSDQVGSTLLYDAYQLKCASCGHSEIFETYPERESDRNWLELIRL